MSVENKDTVKFFLNTHNLTHNLCIKWPKIKLSPDYFMFVEHFVMLYNYFLDFLKKSYYIYISNIIFTNKKRKEVFNKNE